MSNKALCSEVCLRGKNPDVQEPKSKKKIFYII